MNERLKMNGYRANLAPIDFEVDCGPLPVRGELPSRLAGVLVRNGPNPLRPDPAQHWFAGHGMVHRFEFANGGVTYRNRWVRTQRWLAERASVAADVGAFDARQQQRWKFRTACRTVFTATGWRRANSPRERRVTPEHAG
jgi:carotenoid cleavage dioxygenase